MVNYSVAVYNDMGHIMTEPYCTHFPMKIYEIISLNTLSHIDYATDIAGRGCRFYILKSHVPKEWTIQIDDDSLTVKYDLDTFDSNTMKWTQKNDNIKDRPLYYSTITYRGSPLEIN